jgi:hypothetical protein
MEATYSHTPFAARPQPLKRTRWEGTRAALSAVARALAESARGEELDRLFSTSSEAQFAALPRGQQNRLLDRGFRP